MQLKLPFKKFLISRGFLLVQQLQSNNNLLRACSEFPESRREELKKRSLLKVNEHFSTTSNAESGNSKQALFIRLLFLSILSPVFTASPLAAMEVSAGIGGVEEGDDRNRPAAILHVGITKDWQSRGYIWGRTYGPVSETSSIIAVSRRGSIFSSKSLEAAIGVSGMAEHSAITYKDHPEENSSYTSTNIGLMLGLNYNLFSTAGVDVNITWDSHIFPAGGAIIALVTGRKQIVGFTAGIAF